MASSSSRHADSQSLATGTALLWEAAALTGKRSLQDMQQVEEELRPILAHIEQHAFDGNFTIGQLVECFQIKNKQREKFRSEIGRGFKSYLNERRMEVGQWLLANSDLEVWRISSLVGFTHWRHFSQSFRSWSGRSPVEYRSLRESATPAQSNLPKLGFWFRAAVGALPRDQVEDLVKSLDMQTTKPSSEDEGSQARKHLAHAVWSALLLEPEEEWQQIFLQDPFFVTSEFQSLLGEKILKEGRSNRARGVQLARLGLEAIQKHLEFLGDKSVDIQVLGWARLGNAQRLALAFRDAEASFLHADGILKTGGILADRRSEAELLDLKAALLLNQRQFPEAQKVLHRSIALSRLLGDKKRLVKSLVQSAELNNYLDKSSISVCELLEALRSLEPCQDDKYMELAIHGNLAGTYVQCGDLGAAFRALHSAKELCNSVGSDREMYQLLWTEGLAQLTVGKVRIAESAFRKARRGLAQIGERGHAAAISLELAVLCFQQDRWQEAANLASESVSFLLDLEIPDVVAATVTLRDAIITDCLTLGILEETRSKIRRLWRDPGFNPCFRKGQNLCGYGPS